MIAAAVMFVSAYIIKHEKQILLLVAVYAFVSILFAFGIILGTVTDCFFCRIASDSSPSVHGQTCQNDIMYHRRYCMFYQGGFIVKAGYVLAADIIDVTVSGTISAIVSIYMMGLKCERFLYARKVSVLRRGIPECWLELLTNLV